MQPILLTSGEPAGIGPDICLSIAHADICALRVIVAIGDITVLEERRKLLGLNLVIEEVKIEKIEDMAKLKAVRGVLYVINVPCKHIVAPGVVDTANAIYVLNTLDTALDLCRRGLSKAIVTAPIHKGVINSSGIHFSGHTEYFASKCGIDKVVMMLANKVLKVALLTTHLPLKMVAPEVTEYNLKSTLQIIIDYFKLNYGFMPKIAVCGLNPHAGEGGHIGSEEQEIINPLIKQFQQQGYSVFGSFSADTIFIKAKDYDVILAMYHDQGLPVLKYSGFSDGINVTLGLPFIRTSVDHGTALELAGSGMADNTSLICALEFAINHIKY